MKMKSIIGSLTAKFAALLVAFACAGSAWGAETTTIKNAAGEDISVYVVADGFYQSAATYTAATDFYITSKAGLEYFRDLVNGKKSVTDDYMEKGFYSAAGFHGAFYSNNLFNAKTVHLLEDIDLENTPWEPIGYVHLYSSDNDTYYVKTQETATEASAKTYFYGNFDGHNHVISNVNIVRMLNNQSRPAQYWKNYGSYGLFGYVSANTNPTFQNITIRNFSGISGENTLASSAYAGDYLGCIVGDAGSNVVTFRNCHIVGDVSVSSSYIAGCIVGIGNVNVIDCSVEATGGTGIDASTFAGGLVGAERCSSTSSLNITGNTVSGVEVTSYRAGSLVGAMALDAKGSCSVTGNDVVDCIVNGDAATVETLLGPTTATTVMTVENNTVRMTLIVETGDLTPSKEITAETKEVNYTVPVTVKDRSGNVVSETTAQEIAVSVADADIANTTLASVKIDDVVAKAIESVGEDATSVTAIEIQVKKSTPGEAAQSVTYEVHPEAVVTVSKTGEAATSSTVELSNSDLAAGATFTFDLDVSSLNLAEGDKVKVTHSWAAYTDAAGASVAAGSETTLATVSNNKVSITTTHFSTWTLEGITIEPSTVAVVFAANGASTQYTSLAAAVAEATEGQTITLLADATDSLVTIPSTVTLNAGGFDYTAYIGAGTSADPYQIGNLSTLKAFRDYVDLQLSDGTSQYAGKYFKLTTDIDLANEIWEPIGSLNGDHGSFKGVFDGDGHTISNLNVQKGEKGLGFFSYTSDNAEIKNLTFANVTVKSTAPTATSTGSYVGGVVGNGYASTKISNVHLTGTIDIEGYGYVGGIVGHGYVKVSNSSVECEGTISGNMWCVGGIVGYAGEGATDVTDTNVTGSGTGLTIQSAAGGVGAIVGMAEDNHGIQPISGSNLSATNVTVKTFVGIFGTGYATYALGYLYGGNSDQYLSGDLTVNNVTFDAQGNANPPVQDAVATVDDTIYFVLSSAVDAAQSGDIVTVTRNLKLRESISIDSDVTIDLAGKTIALADGVESAFVISGDTTLTVNNGTAVVAIEGYDSNYRVMSETDGAATIYSAVPCAAEIAGTPYRTFAEAIAAADAVLAETDVDPVITVLDANAEQNNPDWRIVGDTLVRKVYVAQVGDQKFETLAEAIAAANDDETVKMLADVSLDVYVRAQNKKITLDLNGKTVSCGAVTTLLVDGAQLTIDDTSESGEGKVVSTSDNTSYGVVFVQNAGAIIVNAGMIVSDCAERPAIRNVNAAGCSIAVAGGAVKNTAGKFAICAHGDADVTITDGAVSAPSWTIINYGTGDIAVGGGSVSATSGNGAIENISTGNVIISGEALISASANQAIRNDAAGKVTVMEGTVSALYYAVNNRSTGPITISGGDINAVGFAILNYSDGEVTISDGNIESVAHAVLNAANGTVTITGGSMLCKPRTGYEGLGEAAIYNGNYWGQTSDPPTTGIINISGGTIRAAYRGAIENHTGTLNISGGDISSLNSAIMNFNPGGAVMVSGNAAITADVDPNGTGCAIQSNSSDTDRFEIAGGKILGTIYFDKGTYSITGGIFSVEPTKGVAEGYSVVSNPDPATNEVYPYAILSDNDAQIVRSGVVVQKGTLAEMVAAAESGDTVQLLKDVEISSTVTLDLAGNVTIDGNGYTVTPSAGFSGVSAFMLGNSSATTLGSGTYTIANTTFSGFNTTHGVLRCQGSTVNIADCTFAGNEQTDKEWGVVSGTHACLAVQDCTFTGNTCAKCIDFNYNGGGTNVGAGSLTVAGNLFSGNTISGSGVIFSNGSTETADSITGNTFSGNTINVTGAGSVLYISGTVEDISGNLFEDNTVTAATGKKEGVIVLGSGSTGTAINDNAFVGNTLSDGTEKRATVYTGADCDLSGNYWGDGAAPETGTGLDIRVDDGKTPVIALTGYATEYATVTGVNGATVTVKNFVAQIVETGVKYENLMEAIDAAYNGGTVELLTDVTVNRWHQNVWSVEDRDDLTYSGDRAVTGCNGLTINGNGHSLTINSIDSGSNGNQIFYGSRNLTVSNITINAASGVEGIGLKSGLISDVTFNMAGSNRAIYTSGSAGCEEGEHIEIRNCTFNTGAADSFAIYSCDPENGVDVGTVISGNTFNTRRSVALRSDMQFLNNTVNGEKGVTVAEGSTAVVSGNYFSETTTSRSINVYPSNATIENNVILGPIELENKTYETAPDLSGNYWGGDAPANLPEGVVVNSYYTTYSGYDTPSQDGSLFTLSDPVVFVAQIGDDGEKFETLAEAIAAANDGETVKLLKDIVVTAQIVIPKSLTLDGNGHTIATTAEWAVNVNNVDDGEVTITNLTITAGSGTKRFVNVQESANLKLNLAGCTMTGCTYYAVNVRGSNSNLALNITDCNISGWCALNIWGAGGTVNVSGGTLGGVNSYSYAPGPSGNDFGVIVLNESTAPYEVTIAGTTLSAASVADSQNRKNREDIVLFNSNAAKYTVRLDGCTIERSDDPSIQGLFKEEDGTSDNLLYVRNTTDAATSAISVLPDGYAYANADSEGWRLVIKPVVAVIAADGVTTNGVYATLADAFAAARTDETIELLVDLTENFSYTEWASLRNKSLALAGNHTLTSTSEWFGYYFGDYDSGNRPETDRLAITNVTFAKSGGNYTLVFDGVAASLNGVTVNGSANTALSYANGATGVLENVTVANTGSHSATWRNAAISLQSIAGGAAQLLVKSGSYTSENGYAAYIFSSGGILTIDGGDFVGKFCANIDRNSYHNDYNQSWIYINGGKFKDVAFETAGDNAYCGYVISGGVFSEAPAAKYLAPGYIVVANTDAETKDAYPYTVTGDIVYPVDSETAGVPVPVAWIKDNTKLITDGAPINVDAVIEGLDQNGANGVPLWQSYVLGFNPTVATSKLVVGASAPVATATGYEVTVKGLNVNIPSTLDSGTKVAFRLEEATPAGAAEGVWTARSEPVAVVEGQPQATVKIDAVAGKLLRIVADIVTVAK